MAPISKTSYYIGKGLSQIGRITKQEAAKFAAAMAPAVTPTAEAVAGELLHEFRYVIHKGWHEQFVPLAAAIIQRALSALQEEVSASVREANDLRELLKRCHQKLEKYFQHVANGQSMAEYVGGPLYGQLMKEIDVALMAPSQRPTALEASAHLAAAPGKREGDNV